MEINGGGELMSSTKDLDFLPGFNLEGFPNRDSLVYKDLYGLNSDVQTVLRGTLRYKGFTKCIQGMQLLGLIDPNPHTCLHPKGPEITWVSVTTIINKREHRKSLAETFLERADLGR